MSTSTPIGSDSMIVARESSSSARQEPGENSGLSPSSGKPSASIRNVLDKKSCPKDGWSDLWEKKLTPWDAGRSSPILERALADGWFDTYKRALVPGCGSGYDLVTLSRVFSSVEGIDLAPLAVQRAEELIRQSKVEDRARAKEADFFTLEENSFDLVYDYTFLCALPPDLRNAWAQQMSTIIESGGELFTLIFPVDSHEGGPPFAMSFDLVQELLENRGFTLFYREDNPPDSIPQRAGREIVARWRRN